MLLLSLAWSIPPAHGATAAEVRTNLALTARASAFEFQPGLPPELANDGKMDTRWSGIPGHNTGGWYELQWTQAVRVAQVVVLQYDRFVKELDVQVWDDAAKTWLTVQHFGQPDRRLPKVVVCRLAPRSTTRLRLAQITNGPSFDEVQVFEEAFAIAPAINLASDANGNFLGMLSDAWGSEPMARAQVQLSGQAKRGRWQIAGRSDEHGLVVLPMPLGMTGLVTATMTLPKPGEAGDPAAGPGTQPAPAHVETFDAVDFQYGLTPIPNRSDKVSLAGRWRFAVDPPADFAQPEFADDRWAEIKVPAHFEMEGFRAPSGIGGYRRTFRAPGGSGRLKLRFEGVYSGAEVWVNGQRLATHLGGALPFETDLTDVVRRGQNLLAVRVAEHTPVSDQLDKMSEYADFPLAGIFRDVYLYRVPPAHVGALQWTTRFDANYRNATLEGQAAILNESAEAAANLSLTLRLTGPDGNQPVAVAEDLPVRGVAPWQRAEVNFALPVTAPRPWEAEHPHLYTLTVELRRGGRVMEQIVRRVGFRQTDLRDGQLRINGRAVKIRGTCHHDSHPLLGRAVTPELTRQDLELMKEANLNSLRTSHYPPIPELLDMADALGLYVEAEGSFCWVNVADDLRYTPRILQLNAELLARDRNHPSIFIWSICNESAFGTGFVRSHEWLHAADPARPHAGSWDAGHVDFLVQHNPITIGQIDRLASQGRPILWDECWCIFQGIWGDVGELWYDPGIRDYYAAPLPRIYARMMASPRVAGTQIWAWSDDLFCVPNRGLEYGRETARAHFVENAYRLPHRGLVGDAPWGVVDGWRRPKPEFWITKKLHSPVKISEAPLPLPGVTVKVRVDNEYDFTDLSELRIAWQLGADRGTVRGAVPPRSAGELELRLPRPPQPGDELGLQFFDAVGRLVDTYCLPFDDSPSRAGMSPESPARSGAGGGGGAGVRRPPPEAEAGRVATPPRRLPKPSPLRITQESILAGRSTHVAGQDFELAFDLASGALRRTVVFGEAVLLDLPALHLLPSGSPANGVPNAGTWRLRQISIEPEQENVRVRIEGSYDHFAGGYDLLITPTGAITAHLAFRYSGETFQAREVGWVLAFPRECDRLRWSRAAEWRVYPDDHIGRPRGEARAFARHADELPPTWSWSQDNSPMGCNDFRSTKRGIHWAALGYADGPGVWITSDRSQNARAMMATDRALLHVSDWYGGSHVGLGEWISNYGTGKPIAGGQLIESTLHLQLTGP